MDVDNSPPPPLYGPKTMNTGAGKFWSPVVTVDQKKLFRELIPPKQSHDARWLPVYDDL